MADLIESYIAAGEKGRHRPNARPKRPGTLVIERHYFEKNIRPRFGNLGVNDLARSQVQRFLDELCDRSLAVALQSHQVLSQAFNYGIRNEVVKANPAQFVALPAAPQRERVLTDAELREIWNGIEETIGVIIADPAIGLAIRLAMLTLQRGGEVAGIHVREIDQGSRLWTLPGDRVKNHRTHAVPLSDAAMSVLDSAFGGGDWQGYAFPARSGAKSPHMIRASLSIALLRLTRRLGIADARAHDFRRTGATFLTGERLGFPRFIVSRVLNHADTGGASVTTSIYDRHEYLSEKRRALDAWAALLMEIVSGTPRAKNITPISAAKA